MIWGDARELLRSQVQEDEADQWTDIRLDRYLNLALQFVQMKEMAVRPDAFVQIDQGPLELNRDDYPWPAGMIYEYEVAILDESTGKYTPLKRASYGAMRRGDLTAGISYYAPRGSEFVISPAPGKTVAAGLQVTFCPTLSVGSDSDVLPVRMPLHLAVVFLAKKYAKGETDEIDPKEDLETIINSIPQYLIDSAESSELQPDIPREYDY